ncbi:MAG TPA: ATP-binding protein [Burkholderiaceae bacterium]|nr:ATP-binding protein [Burkholderiaceae bacterium]
MARFLILKSARLAARLGGWLPGTLFGRLALLLFVAVLASHVLALTLLFELGPGPGPGPWPDAQAWAGVHPPPHPPPHLGPPPHHFLHPGLLLDIGVRLAALMLAAWIGARWLSEPIKRLAGAARDLGRDIDHAPLLEDGTVECREASRVFNQMQARIRQQLDERDQFVAAVSHDLRTPLTRMRLRIEGLRDLEQRQRFGQDIREMDDMIRTTLDYLRGAAHPEALVRLDLTALVHSIADDQRACGHDTAVSGRAAPMQAQASALRRCIGNLVENAIRYGGGAEIRMFDAPDRVRIQVSDCGPGLPEAELVKVLAPFYRVEGSRNRNHGGVGLGLSIAHDIARQHGGSLVLRNGAAWGLVATLTLPRAATPQVVSRLKPV